MTRHLFSGSRANRDRRDQAFCRSVIALAERKRRNDEALATVEETRCAHCHRATCAGDCPQYYEFLRDNEDEHTGD